MEFLHSAMWHVALESWQWIHQVAAPCSVIRGSAMTCHWIRPDVCHIGILHLVSISTTSPQSICHSAPVSEVLYKWDLHRQKKMMSCRFSLKSPCTTSYRSSIETIPLNCLLFEKIAFSYVGDRQTDRQTDKQMDTIDAWSRSLAIASCGLITRKWCMIELYKWQTNMKSYGILVFPYQTLWQYSDGNPLTGALNACGLAISGCRIDNWWSAINNWRSTMQ